MKNKKILILGLLMLLLGFSLCMVSFTKIDKDFYIPYFKETGDKKIIELENNNQSINLNIVGNKVILRKSEDEKIHIIYPDNEDAYIEKADNEKISISSSNEEKNNILKLFKKGEIIFAFERDEIILDIPSNYKGSIDINNLFGDLSIKDIEAKDIQISGINADVTLQRLKIENNIIITDRYGNINFKDSSLNEINIKLNNADIYLENIKIKEDIKIKNSYSDISMKNMEIKKSVDIDSENGDIYMENIFANENIKIENQYGDIKASIKGNIEDYNITTDVSYGEINLGQRQGKTEKILDIESKYGDIYVKFRN